MSTLQSSSLLMEFIVKMQCGTLRSVIQTNHSVLSKIKIPKQTGVIALSFHWQQLKGRLLAVRYFNNNSSNTIKNNNNSNNKPISYMKLSYLGCVDATTTETTITTTALYTHMVYVSLVSTAYLASWYDICTLFGVGVAC
ncbi:hypothetical protein GQX74_014406 [Glossina fuscipes]|nr:hypothetical protein GQX74_014406 [Glossina fuscipes]